MMASRYKCGVLGALIGMVLTAAGIAVVLVWLIGRATGVTR